MPISRRKRSEYLMMGLVAAGGLLAAVLLPLLKKTSSTGRIIVRPSEVTVRPGGGE